MVHSVTASQRHSATAAAVAVGAAPAEIPPLARVPRQRNQITAIAKTATNACAAGTAPAPGSLRQFDGQRETVARVDFNGAHATAAAPVRAASAALTATYRSSSSRSRCSTLSSAGMPPVVTGGMDAADGANGGPPLAL